MNDKKAKLFGRYVEHVIQSKTKLDYLGHQLKYVRMFLEEEKTITYASSRNFRKRHAFEMTQREVYGKSISDFLSWYGAEKQDGVKSIEPVPENVQSLKLIKELSESNLKDLNDFVLWLPSIYDYSRNTITGYSNRMKAFFKYATEFNQENCKRFIQTQNEQGRAIQTIQLQMNVFRTYGKFKNIPITLKSPKSTRSLDNNKIPTKEEYNRLLAYLEKKNNKDHYFWVKILGTTGCRISDFLQIKYEDILEGSMVVCGKGNKYRRIFFSKQLVKEIRQYMKETGATGYVGKNKFGEQITSRGFSQQMKAWAAPCNIPREKMHPHALRHFFAKMMLEKTKDITQVATFLGHADIGTTQIYIQKSFEEQRKDFDKALNW